MKRILSGMQPTGSLHLGNYLGALKNWVKLQDESECFFCVVDLHAITVPQDPQKLRNATRETAAAYIACGIDTTKSILFPQSAVSAHAELAWILGTYTPLGWLNRMTQFKDKAGKNRDLELLGLYTYPVLMAADILAYKATHVPVGEDQKQHVELTRDIAQAFNRAVGQDYFALPEPQILGEATRVMSLRDGTKKMSKSDESDYSRINLTDDLVTIYAALNDSSRAAVLKDRGGVQFSQFKKDLTDLAVAKLAPITAKMRELLAHPENIDRVLKAGAEKANHLTQGYVREIKGLVGLWR